MLDKLDREMLKIASEAVEAGAGIVATETRKRLTNVLSGDGTGDLEKSLVVAPARVNDDGTIDAKVGFHGYDRKGVPNKLKARAMKSGTSKQRKRPFMRPAVNAARKKVIKTMENIVKSRISEIQNSG